MKKTKMKIMSLLLSMVLFLFVPFLNLQAATDHPARLVDQAELLTAEEQQQIQAKLDEVSELHHCDAVVMTVNSLEGKTATEYADDAFDYDGYGLGEDKAGILFLVDMGDRNWATSTHGYAITAFTDAGLSYIEEKLVSYLGDGEYAEAFNCFAEQCDRFLTQAETGEPYEYMDQVDDVQAHIQEIKADLAAGNTAPYREFLNTAIEEAREETAVLSSMPFPLEIISLNIASIMSAYFSYE